LTTAPSGSFATDIGISHGGSPSYRKPVIPLFEGCWSEVALWRISCPAARSIRYARSRLRSGDGSPGSAFRIRNRPRMSPGLRCCSLWPLVSRTPSPHTWRGAARARPWATSSAASITMVWRPSNRDTAVGRRRCTPAPSATGSWRKPDVLQTRLGRATATNAAANDAMSWAVPAPVSASRFGARMRPSFNNGDQQVK
jgi:hypothetical protein